MAYELSIEGTGVYWRYYGAVDYSEIMVANESMWGNPDYDHATFQLFDMLEIDELTVSVDQAMAFAYMDKEAMARYREMKIAIVIEVDRYDLREPWETYASAFDKDVLNARIFGSMQAARSWLIEGK